MGVLIDYQIKFSKGGGESIRIPQNSLKGKDFAKFCRFTKTSSAREPATWAELGRVLAGAAEVTSGVAGVIGNLLAFGQALRT